MAAVALDVAGRSFEIRVRGSGQTSCSRGGASATTPTSAAPRPGAVDARTGAASTAAGANARQRLFVLVIFFFVRSAHFLLPR